MVKSLAFVATSACEKSLATLVNKLLSLDRLLVFFALKSAMPRWDWFSWLLAFDGRSITLYEEVHDINTKEKPATHKCFLRTLKHIINDDSVKPIMVTDAGFKAPWFRAVLKLGWDYVGRTRLLSHYHDGAECVPGR